MTRTSTPIVLGGLLWLAASAPELKAQVSLYNYSESVEPYIEVEAEEASYSLGVPTWWPPLHNLRAWANNSFFEPDGQVTNGGYLSPAIGPGYEIGFDFRYNGDVFDRIGVANGGWISFGKSSDGNRSVVIFTSDHSAGRPLSHSYWQPAPSTNRPDHDYQRNRIAGWGSSALRMQDLRQLVPPGPVSSLRLATIGTAPNRVCVIQYKDFRTQYSNVTTNLVNFQIRLYETTNVVEVRFGPTLWGDMSGAVQIGLGGRTNEDFNNRKTVFEEPAFLYDWNITVAGVTNEDHCVATSEQPGNPNGSGIKPEEGRTFRWSPPACPPPAWPLAVSDIAFNGALASWSDLGSGGYDYFVSAVNDINGPEAASGTAEEAQAYIEGLEPATTYYVFVRSHCAGQPGAWGLGTPFVTHGGGYLACPGTPLEEDFCANAQHSTFYWSYVSEDGVSPVKIDFIQGTVGGAANAFGIWEGASTEGPADFSATGELAGYTYTSTGPQITIRLVTDAGSCGFQSWYRPLQWRVGCKDCVDPLALFTALEPDCDNDEFSVEVNVFSMGTATTLNLVNTLGLPPTVAAAAGTTYTVGPFPTGTSLVITAEHSENPMCYYESPAMVGLPCAVEDCGPTEYTLCYGDNDHLQRAYRGANGQEIGIRFIEGTIGFGDNVNVYNGADPGEVGPTAVPTLVNTLLTSGAPSTDRTLVLELISDASHSCADVDSLFGTSQAWRYVVACYDGCTQPRATFATVCADQTHFNVEVTITELGNTGSVTISNDGGVASTTATAAGTYTVGPFASGTPVKFEVVGASVLCTWASSPMNRSCTGIGIEEAAAHTMALFPNPNDGRFTLELPEAMSGAGELQVLDLAGRMVAQQRLTGTAIQQVDLSALPNGLYALLLRDNGRTFNGKVSIQH